MTLETPGTRSRLFLTMKGQSAHDMFVTASVIVFSAANAADEMRMPRANAMTGKQLVHGDTASERRPHRDDPLLRAGQDADPAAAHGQWPPSLWHDGPAYPGIHTARARAIGFSLEEIRTLLRLGGPERATCREVRAIATRHLEDIRTKLSDLKKLERLLSKTVARCSGKTAPECPVLEILDIERTR